MLQPKLRKCSSQPLRRTPGLLWKIPRLYDWHKPGWKVAWFHGRHSSRWSSWENLELVARSSTASWTLYTETAEKYVVRALSNQAKWGAVWEHRNGSNMGRKRTWMHDVTLIPRSIRNCYVTLTSIGRPECFMTYTIILAFDLIEVEFCESKPLLAQSVKLLLCLWTFPSKPYTIEQWTMNNINPLLISNLSFKGPRGVRCK